VNDEAFYNQVAEEIQAKKMLPGLWTKAFAQAGGDTERARAVYIKLRVAQLIGNSRKKLFNKYFSNFLIVSFIVAAWIAAFAACINFFVIKDSEDSSHTTTGIFCSVVTVLLVSVVVVLYKSSKKITNIDQ
jgi:hypothetical protein